MSATRFIPHGDYDPGANLAEVRESLVRALRNGVERVRRHPSSKPGVYVGAGGYLMLSWKLTDALADLKIEPINVDMSRFDLIRVSSGSRASFLETSVGTATLLLAQHLRTPSDGTQNMTENAIRIIRDAIQVAVNEELADDGCGVLYGRAGLLYASLYLRTQLASAKDVQAALLELSSDRHVKLLVDDIVARGKLGAKEYVRELLGEEKQHVPALMWRWHGKRYLGAAHGVAGILQILLSAPEHILVPHWDAILETVEWLLSIQQSSGNWPHKASKHMYSATESDDEFVQWCHGAPGVLILLSSLLQRTSASLPLPDPLAAATRTALARGAALVYARGLRRKGVGLCHGDAGSVCALLAVGAALSPRAQEPRTLGELDLWRARAVHLARLACSYEDLTRRGEMGAPDRPYSLYEGVAGMCAAWVDVVSVLDGRAGGGMVGFADLVVLTDPDTFAVCD